jgi:K+-transporting ATPase ATPase A chain
LRFWFPCSENRGGESRAPTGFSEILYAFSSASNNNGSAFAGLATNNMFYNIALGLAMLLGRYWLMIPALAIAGALARKKHVPPSVGTLPYPYASFYRLADHRRDHCRRPEFLPGPVTGPVCRAFGEMKI